MPEGTSELAWNMTLYAVNLFSCHYLQGPGLDLWTRSTLEAECALKGCTLEGDEDTQRRAVGQAERGKCHEKAKKVPWHSGKQPGSTSND